MACYLQYFDDYYQNLDFLKICNYECVFCVSFLPIKNMLLIVWHEMFVWRYYVHRVLNNFACMFEWIIQNSDHRDSSMLNRLPNEP